MRKESRAMSAEWALGVIDKAPFVTLSVTRPDGTPYGVPLNIVRTDDHTFYFHCAGEGEKLDCIKANPNVCISAVGRCKPTVGPKDGSFTLEYQSAIGFGIAEVITSDEEKILALRTICQRFLPDNMHNFEPSIARSLARTTVVRITLTQPLTGKRKQYDSHGEEMKYGRME